MKITIFNSAQGDCLLLTSSKGKRILVDGGPASAFRENISPLLFSAAKGRLDLVCVSHIDSDHIAGILQLLEDLVAWRRYDYQVECGNTAFKPPRSSRPPEIDGIWHNGLKDLTGANESAIQDQFVANLMVMNADEALVGTGLAAQAPKVIRIAASIKESLSLSQVVSLRQLGLQVNSPSGGAVILAPASPQSISFDNLQVFILGPSPADLEKLRRDWNKWLQQNQDVVAQVRREFQPQNALDQSSEDQAALASMTEAMRLTAQLRLTASELGDRSLVTPPNLASLMFMVKEGKKTLLMTGDGHYRDILNGLAAQGLLDPSGRIHVSVLKVQHHGSENNIHPSFCQAVTADHYLFCGNGTDANPNLEVLQAVLDSRLKPAESPLAAGKPFKFWFSCKPSAAGKLENIDHMNKVMQLVKSASAASAGRLQVKFPSRAKLTLQL